MSNLASCATSLTRLQKKKNDFLFLRHSPPKTSPTAINCRPEDLATLGDLRRRRARTFARFRTATPRPFVKRTSNFWTMFLSYEPYRQSLAPQEQQLPRARAGVQGGCSRNALRSFPCQTRGFSTGHNSEAAAAAHASTDTSVPVECQKGRQC